MTIQWYDVGGQLMDTHGCYEQNDVDGERHH